MDRSIIDRADENQNPECIFEKARMHHCVNCTSISD
jgi:hypothetical protein